MNTYKEGCLDTINLVINNLKKEIDTFNNDDIAYTCLSLKYLRELEILRMNIKEMLEDEEK